MHTVEADTVEAKLALHQLRRQWLRSLRSSMLAGVLERAQQRVQEGSIAKISYFTGETTYYNKKFDRIDVNKWLISYKKYFG